MPEGLDGKTTPEALSRILSQESTGLQTKAAGSVQLHILPNPLPAHPVLAFRTAIGTTGILWLEETDDPQHRIKIRYRLCENTES